MAEARTSYRSSNAARDADREPDRDAPDATLGRFDWRQLLPATPLERRLFLTVFIGLLPLAILSFATLLWNAQSQRTQVLRAAQDTMRALITAVDSELDESLAALDALAASPRLAAGDLSAFRSEALELLERRDFWRNIVLYDATAEQLMNARVAPGEPLPQRVDPSSVEQTVRTGEPQVTNLSFNSVLNMHAFAVRLPVEQNGRVAYVLTAAIGPDALQTLLTRQNIPEGGVVAIFDRNFNVVARSSGQEEWINEPASPGMLRLLEQGLETGWGTTATLEGTSVYSVYYRSATSGWSAAVGIPTAELDGPIFRSYTVLGGSILLSALLGMFASSLVARTISRPMRELEKAANAMGKGHRPATVHTSLPEIQHASAALIKAHAEREELLHSERQARFREQEARHLAERANRAKDEFLAMLGHELRNPLAAISSASRVLSFADTLTADVAQQASGIIQRQVAHLAQMTDDLLDTGRVVMGKIQVDRKPVDLAAVVGSALDTLRDAHRLAQHELKVSLQSVWVEADPGRLEQIVANLMTNAVKYTPTGGSIVVDVAREDDEAVLRVRDSGLGLDPDLLPHVFDLFVQGRRTLDRSQGGLGLGLTLVRRLVELHNGRVEAHSEGHGKGSEFVVSLPAIAAPTVPVTAATPAAERNEAEALDAQRIIVVVEDNTDVRMSLIELLKLKGHVAYDAADGRKGVDTILRERPDIAIVDIGLPELDGYEVARAVRRQDPNVYLIALTGYGNDDDVAEGSLAGFDDYLVKPVDTALLDRLIANAPARAH